MTFLGGGLCVYVCVFVHRPEDLSHLVCIHPVCTGKTFGLYNESALPRPEMVVAI